MKVELENVKPMEIEKRSFEIITEELLSRGKADAILPENELVVKRVIHTTADFDYDRLGAAIYGDYYAW